jgi:glycosyltransferase involved in cell wall biosynthesis
MSPRREETATSLGRGAHVLLAIENMSYTYDTRVRHIATTLAAAGLTPHVFSPRFAGDARRMTTIDGVEVRTYRQPQLSGILGHLLEYTISIPAIIGALLRERLAGRAQIVHVCNPPDAVFVAAGAAHLLGSRVVYDQHDLNPELFDVLYPRAPGWLRRLVLLAERLAVRMADEVIVTNDTARRRAIEHHGIPPERVTVVRNGPRRTEIAQIRTAAPREPKTVSVGYVGNINPQDGLWVLLEAARELVIRRKRAHLRFVVVGDGSIQRAMLHRLREAGLANVFELTGRLSPERALDRIARCDICVQPDPPNPFTEATTMVKALEYMALARPVVAFDLPETRVSCGDAALYAAGHTALDFADAIDRLAGDPTLRRMLGDRGRRRATRLFWEHAEQPLLAVYRRCLFGRNDSAGEGTTVEISRDAQSCEGEQGRREVDQLDDATLAIVRDASAGENEDALTVMHGRAGSAEATRQPVEPLDPAPEYDRHFL